MGRMPPVVSAVPSAPALVGQPVPLYRDTEGTCWLPFVSEFTWAVTCLSSHQVLACGPCAMSLKPHI